MARGRHRAAQVLALHSRRRRFARNARQHRQATLAYRARLSGPQAGTRARPLRGGAAGAASIIMQAFALPLTDSSSPKGRRFPPQRRSKPKTARNLTFPKVTDSADPPIRPERHTPNSIATVRRHLTVALSPNLQRFPCCTRINAARTYKLVTQ